MTFCDGRIVTEDQVSGHFTIELLDRYMRGTPDSSMELF